MKKIVTIVSVLFLLAHSHTYAQVSRPMTAQEAAFMNKVSNALINSVPKDFHGWSINFPEYQNAVAGETRVSGCAYGKDCFYSNSFHLVYDGASGAGPDRDKFQDSMKNVAYDWHMAALMSRYMNTHQLTVDISFNETSYISEFRYCTSGYQTLTQPGFDHYLFASVMKCFPKEAQGDIEEVNLFIMGKAPNITPRPHDGYNKAYTLFPINAALPSPFKVQNIVVRIAGSKALAKEYISKMNLTELKNVFNK